MLECPDRFLHCQIQQTSISAALENFMTTFIITVTNASRKTLKVAKVQSSAYIVRTITLDLCVD